MFRTDRPRTATDGTSRLDHDNHRRCCMCRTDRQTDGCRTTCPPPLFFFSLSEGGGGMCRCHQTRFDTITHKKANVLVWKHTRATDRQTCMQNATPQTCTLGTTDKTKTWADMTDVTSTLHETGPLKRCDFSGLTRPHASTSPICRCLHCK
jgi:hypothetical protein